MAAWLAYLKSVDLPKDAKPIPAWKSWRCGFAPAPAHQRYAGGRCAAVAGGKDGTRLFLRGHPKARVIRSRSGGELYRPDQCIWLGPRPHRARHHVIGKRP